MSASTYIQGADTCNNKEQAHVFAKIKDGGKTIPKCSDMSKSECSGSAINSEGQGFINHCEQGFWWWEDDCVDDDSAGCSISLPSVVDPDTGNRKLKYSRNFTDNDYAQVCAFARDSEPNFYIKSMRQREPVMGRPKNPDGFDTSLHAVWTNAKNMCSAAGLEKVDSSKYKGIEELNLDCEKRTKDSCEQSEGDSSLYPTKTGGLCFWVDETTPYFDKGCWQYGFMCGQITDKESCESHPSHLCWWDPKVRGVDRRKWGLCTKYTLLEDTYLNTTNNVPRSDYWFKTDGLFRPDVNWKEGRVRKKEKSGKLWSPCVPTNEPLKDFEVFSNKFECENYWNGRSICDRETLTCSEETINYSDKDETYSSQELCSEKCTAEFGCFANEDGVKVCRQVGKGDKKPSKTYDSLEECNEGTNYCNDRRWGCLMSRTGGGVRSCREKLVGESGYPSKEACEEGTNYCGNPPAPRFACLNEGNGRECTQLPQGAVFDPSYISLKACQTESNYCGRGPPRKWGCLNMGSGKECTLYPEGADSPYNTKEECEKGTNFCKN